MIKDNIKDTTRMKITAPTKTKRVRAVAMPLIAPAMTVTTYDHGCGRRLNNFTSIVSRSNTPTMRIKQ